jgi:peptide/nickel transport system permease protein
MRFLKQSWKASGKFRFGVIVLGVLIFLAIIAPLIYNPFTNGQIPARPGVFAPWMKPSPQHPLGTDGSGRDVIGDFLGGLQSTLLIGFLAGTAAMLVGVVIGFIAGYKGGRIDTILMSFTNMLLVIPAYPILVGLTLVLPQKTLLTMAFILAIFAWPFAARTIRAQVIGMKQQSYVELAKVSGQSDMKIIFTELMPNLMPYLLVAFAFTTVGAMVAEVGVSIIGLGPSNTVTLGMMIGLANGWGVFSRGLWALLLVPPAVLILIFVAITMINRGMEEYLNPRLQNVTGK